LANRRIRGTEEREKLAVSTLYWLGFDFGQVLRTIGRSSIRNWEIFDDGLHRLNKLRVEQLRKIARSRDVSYTVHGPICDLNLATLNSELQPRILKRMMESLTNAASLEAETWVLHPGTHGALSWVHRGDDWKVNRTNIETLQTRGKKLGIPVTIENISAGYAVLGSVKDFLRLYREWRTGPDMTLDIGHSHIKNETELFLKKLRDRIRSVHLHDNNGDVDTHLALGAGTLDWKRTIKTLVESGFDGKIIVESVKGPYASLVKVEKLLRSLN